MSNKTKEQLEFARFLAQIGHEIRTPLNAIKGFGELLADETVGELNPAQKKYMVKITDNAQKLLLVVNQILDWAKLESDQIMLDKQPLNLSRIAEEVGNLMELRMQEKQLTYTVNEAGWASVNGDWSRLREVMVNLVGNSIKFTDKGGHITVSFEQKEQYIITHVTDDGCGISQEKVSQLFEPFSKGMDRPGEEKNSGLGLWICRSIIELHDGHIWVNSEQGKGTTFSFALPGEEIQA
ncbi:MAG: HAMP domain-containing histidine kinase [Peptococcaceae bacterium]|nr:HAMP domain-containing histidine kinase [Peptococcaceae bacterium]